MNQSRTARVFFFSTLTVAAALTACGSSSSSPSSSSEGGSSSGAVSAGGSAGSSKSSAGAASAGAANAGTSSGASGAATGGSAGGSGDTGGASPGGTSGATAGGQSFGGVAGANTGGSTHGGSSSGGSSSGGSATGGAGGVGAAPWQFPVGITKPRIMIVGDSISAGPGCYKKYLLQALTDNHYSKFEFVGEYSDDCGGGVRHSAVSCSTAEQYTHATFTVPSCSAGTFKGLSGLMASQKPDLVMLQLGVNDVWGNKSVTAILASYTTLVQQARAANPAVVLAVARIQKIRPDCSADPALTNQAQALESAVPAWAQQLSTTTSPIFTADLWTNSDWSKTETIDCVHPNDVGAKKMGVNWYNTLKTILTPN